MLKMSTNRNPKMNFRKGIELGSELFLLLWFAFGIGTSTCDSRGSLVSSSIVYQAGDTALLPCDISVPPGSSANGGDGLTLVMWYREDVGSPIYSIDARSGVHIPNVGSDVRNHWFDKNLFGANRVVFDTSPSPDKAKLKIFNVSESDDGIYRCRVDFKASQTRTSRLNLTIIVPPSKPKIILQPDNGNVEGYLGPYQIGTRLALSCQVFGGKPQPRVVWYKNGRTYSAATWTTRNPETGSMMTYSNITLESLSRDDVHTKLTCQASNVETNVLRTSVELDMKYQAHNVTIHNKGALLRAGSQHEFTCEAIGSRPAATLTWWITNQQIHPQLDNVQMTTSVSGELSTSTLTYTPQANDSGKILHCRATNPEMERGILEDAWELNVQYPPNVIIQLGKSLISTEIRQGIDVYFDCIIHANPPPKSKIVTWLHNGEILKLNRDDDTRARYLLPSVNDPNVLVLQGVKKAARGNYSCRVGNGIPTHDHEVTSPPVFLDVKFPPVCSPQGVKVYGVAKMETAHIACNVESNPPDVTFRWTFNNSAEAKTVSNRYIRSNGTRSVLTFTPTRTLEYGTLMCWSTNSVGEQKAPCVFHIIAAGKPEPVQNCSVVNESTDSFQVNCAPGFNGGLPQQFTLAVYKVRPDTEFTLAANLTASSPSFTVSGLDPGSSYAGELIPHNVKGTGRATRIQVYTLKLPEKLIPHIEKGPAPDDGSHQMELNPLMLTILGVVAGVLIVIVLVTAALRIHTSRSRRRRSEASGGHGRGTTDKVIVTTIEELDIDHNNATSMIGGVSSSSSSTANLMALDHIVAATSGKNNKKSPKSPDLVSFVHTTGPDHHSPFDEFRPFPATLGQQQQQPLKLLHHNHHNNSNSREYLNFIHHAAAGHRQHHHHHRGPQQQQQQQPVRRGSLEVNTSSRVMKLPTPPPPPNTTGPDGQPSKGPHCIRASQGPLDYCTLRHGVVGKQARAVQFADQQLERQGSDTNFPIDNGDDHQHMFVPPPPPPTSSTVPQSNQTFIVPHIHPGSRGPPPPGFTYATLRPGQRAMGGHGMGEVTFHEFVPPPPPMFESGAPAVLTRPAGVAGPANGEEPKKKTGGKKQESCV